MRDQYGERLLRLERQLYDLQTELNGNRHRMVSQVGAPPTRVAKIAAAPTSPEQKTFSVIFLDGTYPDAAGPGDATWVDRQNTAKHVAYNLGNKQPAENDRVLCHRIGGRWWFTLNEAGNTTVEALPSETMVMYGARFWYVIGENANTERTNVRGIHNPLQNLNNFWLSWRWHINQQPWFQVSNTQPWQFYLNKPGLYQFHCNVNMRPYRIQTVGPAPSPIEHFSHYVWFEQSPLSCNQAGVLTKHIVAREFDTNLAGTGSLAGSVSDPMLSTCEYLTSILSHVSGYKVGQVNLIPPSLKPFKFQSILSGAQDTDYGVHVDDITMTITRLATDDQIGTVCPTEITTQPS